MTCHGELTVLDLSPESLASNQESNLRTSGYQWSRGSAGHSLSPCMRRNEEKERGRSGWDSGLNISIWKGDLSLRLDVKVNSLELTSPRQHPNLLSLQTSTLHTLQVSEWSKYLFIYSPPALLLSNRLMRLLSGTYGEDAVTRTTKGDQISVKLDGQIAVIDLETLVRCWSTVWQILKKSQQRLIEWLIAIILFYLSKEVECLDESLQSHVACTVKRLHNTMVPCHSWDKWRWTTPSGWKKACKIKLKNARSRL